MKLSSYTVLLAIVLCVSTFPSRATITTDTVIESPRIVALKKAVSKNNTAALNDFWGVIQPAPANFCSNFYSNSIVDP